MVYVFSGERSFDLMTAGIETQSRSASTHLVDGGRRAAALPGNEQVTCGSNYPTIAVFPQIPGPHPPYRAMTTPESWAVEHYSTTTAMLNTDIHSLTVLKDTVDAIPVRAMCESVITILALVRVRLLTLFPSSHPLIGETTRMR